jgi:hypothetical protein
MNPGGVILRKYYLDTGPILFPAVPFTISVIKNNVIEILGLYYI